MRRVTTAHFLLLLCVCVFVSHSPEPPVIPFCHSYLGETRFSHDTKEFFPPLPWRRWCPTTDRERGYRLCINLHMEIGNARASFQNSQSHFQSYFNKIVSESCESPTIRGWIFLDPSDGISQPFWDGKSNPTHPRDQSYVEILLHVSIRYCHPLWSTRRTIYRWPHYTHTCNRLSTRYPAVWNNHYLS